MYSATQVDVMGSWVHSKDESAKPHYGDQVSFSRPAITTGAHMPWNSRNRTSYVAPRAFTNLQTVPPITILNHKQEVTKLVFSKEPQPSTMIVPAETPFQHVAHISISDEEEKKAKSFPRPPAIVRPSEMRPPVESKLGGLGPLPTQNQNLAPRRNLVPSISASTQTNLSSQQPRQKQMTAPDQQVPVEKAEPPNVSMLQLPSRDSQIAFQPTNRGEQDAPGNVQSVAMKEPSPFLLSHPDSALAESTHFDAQSLVERSSGDSTQMVDADSGVAADLCLEHLDNSWPVAENIKDGSRSEDIAPGKRKAKSWDGISSDGVLGEYLSSTAAFSGRPLKRRLSPKSFPSKLNERKTQEYRRMENVVLRLQSEQSDLQSRLSIQTKTCDELRTSLQSAEQKLKEQEEVNTKLMLEMQFLKGSLLPVSEADLSGIQTPGRPCSLPSSQPSSSLQELPWMDRLASICMPTLAEVAADFEADCPLIQPPEGSLSQDWQIW